MDLYSIRRKNNSQKKGSIFPLVSQLLPDDAPQGDPIASKFCIFEADLSESGAVVVSNKDHIKDIYSGSYFGKGNCSYAEPKFEGSTHDRIMKTMYGQEGYEMKGKDVGGAVFDKAGHPVQSTTENEELILTHEETFFLAFGLGILRVRRAGHELSLDELYAEFLAQNDRFPLRYKVYHHLRHKGWVVRPGCTMGVEYLLYKDGPPFTHSSFMVLVRTDEDDCDLPMEELTEHRLDVLTRISGSVQKVLLLCYVLRPPGVNFKEASCLRELEVCEIITSRWEPNRR